MSSKFFKATLITAATFFVLTGCGSQVLAAPNLSNRAINAASRSAQKQEDRLERLKAKAEREIDRRLNTLKNILTKFGEAKKLTDADKAALTTQIQSEIDSLTSLKTKIAADTDLATLRTDVQSIVKDYRVYALIAPKVRIILASNRVLALVDKLNTYVSKLQTIIDSAKATGKDAGSLQSTLDDLKAKLNDAKTQAQKANTSVINITPDQYNADHSILKGPRDNLKNARTDLIAARKDAQTIISGLKDLKVRPSSSSAATSSATTP